MTSDATFSLCRTYRYDLWRRWIGGDGYAMFVGLNPSTADETEDDPTIRRCIAYAKAWGYSGLCMTNLFAYRATEPKKMMQVADPVGPSNDATLRTLAGRAGVVVAAWGTHGTHLGRGDAVRELLPALHYLRLTKDGHPGHPLYLPKTLVPVAWGYNAKYTDEARYSAHQPFPYINSHNMQNQLLAHSKKHAIAQTSPT